MDLSGLSALSPGFARGQDQKAALAQDQEAAKQAKLRTQGIVDDRDALMALGRAFGVAPPNAPAPQAPGQPSQPAAPAQPPMPTTSGGQPVTPPGGYFNPQPGAQASAPPRPPAGPGPVPPPGSAPRPPAPPAQPRSPAAPGLPPQVAALQGQMSTDALAQRIIKANPGIQKRPDLLVRAMVKGQALLAPDAKAELQSKLLEMKLDQFQQSMSLRAASERDRTAYQTQLLGLKAQIAQLTDQRQRDALLQRVNGLESKNRADLVKSATKAGVKVDPAWTNDEIQAKVADAQAKLNQQGVLDDGALKNLAVEAHSGVKITSQLGYGKTRNANVAALQKKLTEMYGPDVTDQVVAAQVRLAGDTSASRAAGGQEGRLGSAVNELKPWGALVKDLSKEVDRGRFTTLNKWELWARQHVSDPKTAKYLQAVTGLKSIYAQIMARGRKPNAQQIEEAGRVIDSAYSNNTLDQIIDQITKEGDIARGAARQSVKDAGDSVSPGAGGSSGSGASSTDELPAAARTQLKEGVITTFGNGQKWTLKNGQPEQVQ